jgi:hypothetical protein
MRLHASVAALFVLAVSALPGCSCERALNKKTPVAVVVDGTFDFGEVQVNLVHRGQVRVRNDGSAPLTLTEPSVDGKFALATELPVTLSVGEELPLEVTFSPVEVGVQEAATLSFTTDDPENLRPSVSLKGTGITAAAVFSARPLDFGDVYAGESRTVTLKVTNAGSATLKVLSVEPVVGTPSAQVLVYDLAPLRSDIPAGQSAEATFTFSPAEMMTLSGGLVFTFDTLQGGEQVVPFQGRGVKGIPAVCFRFEGQGTESCTAVSSGQLFEAVTVNFGALCDASAYPVGTDGGCTQETSARTAQVYVKNAGNTPVQYELKYVAYANANADPCDAGTPAAPDFLFSNAPNATAYSWTEPQVQLPSLATATPPWESMPVALTYRPTARCVAEGADQARVELTRKGDPASRFPQKLTAFVQGASALPNLQPALGACGAVGSPQSVPCTIDFFGVINQGSWPARLESVELHEELTDGGLSPCSAAADPDSACHRFAWADGGTPQLPFELGAAVAGVGTKQRLGQVVFGPAGGGAVTAGTLYRVVAVTRTNDPFRPEVQSRIEGVGQ